MQPGERHVQVTVDRPAQAPDGGGEDAGDGAGVGAAILDRLGRIVGTAVELLEKAGQERCGNDLPPAKTDEALDEDCEGDERAEADGNHHHAALDDEVPDGLQFDGRGAVGGGFGRFLNLCENGPCHVVQRCGHGVHSLSVKRG